MNNIRKVSIMISAVMIAYVIAGCSISDSGEQPAETIIDTIAGTEVESEAQTVDIANKLQARIDEGYIFINSTQEGIDYINEAAATSEPTIRLCYEPDSVDADILMEAAKMNYSAIGDYNEVNLSGYSGNRSVYTLNVEYKWYTSSDEAAELEKRVAAVIPSVNQGNTYAKVKNVHDFICNNVDYCYDTDQGDNDNYSAYDAIVNGKGVCSGYALLFQKFMEEMNIPSYIAAGPVIRGGETVSHAWNIVNIDGIWYSIDCTWDGQDTITSYDYFLLGAESLGYSSWGAIELSPVNYPR